MKQSISRAQQVAILHSLHCSALTAPHKLNTTLTWTILFVHREYTPRSSLISYRFQHKPEAAILMASSSTTGHRRPPQKGPNLVPHLLRRQSGDQVLGFRRRLCRERLGMATSLYKRDLVAHFGCVNAIEFSGDGELLVSGEYPNVVLQSQKTKLI